MYKEADASLGLAPISHIDSNLCRMFGQDWIKWEPETISMELGLILDDLTRDKIHVLQLIKRNPDLFFHDATFFLHAVEVINNKVADFDHFPIPTSLEIAYAIHEAKQLNLPVEALKDPDTGIVEAIIFLLREEGYSEPVAPFDFIPKERLEQGQTPIDVEAKKKAIEIYIKEMGD